MFPEPTGLSVFNLSSKILSPAHVSLLNKGLSFGPTTQCNDFDVKVDMFKFFRNIRLREYFSSPNSDTSIEPVGCSPAHTPTPFRSKSYFIPPANRNHSIETYCRLVLLKNKQGSKSFHNLPKNEKQALLDGYG